MANLDGLAHFKILDMNLRLCFLNLFWNYDFDFIQHFVNNLIYAFVNSVRYNHQSLGICIIKFNAH